MHHIGIVFLGRQPDQFAQGAAHGKGIAIGALAGHGIECVGKGYDAHRHGHVVHKQTVGVSRAIAALMVPAHNFGNAWPGKLHIAYDLMSNDGVVSHLADSSASSALGLPNMRLSTATLPIS